MKADFHLIHGMVTNMPKGFVLGHETMGIAVEDNCIKVILKP